MEVGSNGFGCEDFRDLLGCFVEHSTRLKVGLELERQRLIVRRAVRTVFIAISRQVGEKLKTQTGAPHGKISAAFIHFDRNIVNVPTSLGVAIRLIEPCCATGKEHSEAGESNKY